MASPTSPAAQVWADLTKFLSKYSNDKSLEVKIQVGKAFKNACKCMKPSIAANSYDNLYYFATRMFEEENKAVRNQYSLGLVKFSYLINH